MKNYYETLGVSETASVDEIKKAYKKLARENHPDMANGNNLRMQAINEAYDTLKDPTKKKRYDAGLNGGPSQHNQHKSHNFGFGFGPGFESYDHAAQERAYQEWARANAREYGASPDEFESMFKNMYEHAFGDGMFRSGRGSPFRKRYSPQNEDVNLSHTISMEEAYSGKNVKTTLKFDNGESKTISFDIPPGIKDGSKIRIRGAGPSLYNRSPPGDVYIHINVKPHAIFDREGNDLKTNINVDALDAILGTSTHVKHIDGSTFNLKIPAGCQPGDQLRCKGKGFKSPSGVSSFKQDDRKWNDEMVYGDMFVKVHISIPKTLTPEEEARIREVRELRNKA